MIKLNNINPDILSSLNRRNDIILCVPKRDFKIIDEISEDSDIFSIFLAQDINLSTCKTISPNLMEILYKPQLKISIPVGIKMMLEELTSFDEYDIFQKIYKKYITYEQYNEEKEKTHILITDLELVGYIDSIRMRSTPISGILRKGLPMINVFFTWYVQTKASMSNIENIFFIEDQYVYEEFLSII